MAQTASLQNLRVAIVHDWLVGGGAELVVEQLHQMFPEAPIYTSYATPQWRQRLDNKVVTGWLQHFGRVRKFIPVFRIWWFGGLRFDGYDLVISSSGAEAKGIKVPAGTVHVNYCHAPTHYYWSRYEEYLRQPGFGKLDLLARLSLKLLVGPLRSWDYRAAQRPHHIIANSSHIQQEIKKYYGRDSVVIHPPVLFERFQKSENSHLPRHGFIISGRQTPYKRFDLAVAACTVANLPLTVIGDGPDNKRLRSLAGPSVIFLGRVSDKQLEKAFASAEALIFPGLDDFGITAIEAMAAGTPVIAYQAGGALDYITPGKTGEFFKQQTTQSLQTVLTSFAPKKYNSTDIKNYSTQFDAAHFKENMHRFLNKVN